MIKVKELIKQLLEMPLDANVVLHVNNSGEVLETCSFDEIVVIGNLNNAIISNVDRRTLFVEKKLQQMERGNIGVSWTGMVLTIEEYDRGVKAIEKYPDKELAKKVMGIFKIRKPPAYEDAK